MFEVRGWTLRGAAAAWVLCAPLAAFAQGTLGAKGDTIHGRVADLTAEGVVFEPASGKGQIAVKWADVESLETGDAEEGLRAAAAIGDDRIQKMSGRGVHPESFTHGSSEQRARWLRRGLESGDPEACNTSVQEKE